MEVSAWKDGKSMEPGAVYGIRISKKDRDNFFNRKWETVKLKLPNNDEFISINLTDSFWKQCIELRDKRIGQWLINNGNGTWKKGQPSKFELVNIEGKKFKLTERN